MTAARLSMPYHDQRRLPDMKRADYMVSSNIGRTLHATRQAVLEIRQLAWWLREQGYDRIGVMGTSIGSCVTYLAFVHEPLISTGVFNHVSSHFADVVWTGLSTRYIRWGLDGHISLEDLRHCWAPISPWFYVDRLKDRNRPHLLITAKYDLSFRPELSQKVFDQYDSHGIPDQRAVLRALHHRHLPFQIPGRLAHVPFPEPASAGRGRLMTGNLLLSGHPGVGKTTLLRKLLGRLSHLALTGFFTAEIREAGQRTGFRAVALNGSSAVFAHRRFQTQPRQRVGPYGVKPEVLEQLVLPHLDPFRKAADLVVVDEIAAMELLSAAFKTSLLAALDSPCPVLGTVALRGTGFIKQVKRRPDVEIFTLAPHNREVLGEEIHRRVLDLLRKGEMSG